jgi:hypothetical protein
MLGEPCPHHAVATLVEAALRLGAAPPRRVEVRGERRGDALVATVRDDGSTPLAARRECPGWEKVEQLSALLPRRGATLTLADVPEGGVAATLTLAGAGEG